ncbi:MAG: hypothetical protein AB7Q17_10755 [Phycisphaerae bacterium]
MLTLRGGPLAAGDPRWLNAVRNAVAVLLVVQFWLWLPIAWPVWALAVWGVLTPNRAQGGAGPARSVLRGLALVTGFAGFAFALAETASTGGFPTATIRWFVIASPLVTLAAILPLTRIGDPRRLRRLGRVALLLALTGALLAVGLLAGRTTPLASFVFSLGVIGAVVVSVSLPLMLWTLAWVWRRVEAAELLSASYRAELTAWGQARIAERAAAASQPNA